MNTERNLIVFILCACLCCILFVTGVLAYKALKETPKETVETPLVAPTPVPDIYSVIGSQSVNEKDTDYGTGYIFTKVVDNQSGDTILIVRQRDRSQSTATFYP